MIRALKFSSLLFPFFLILMMFCCYSATAQLYPTANLSTTWTTNGTRSVRLMLLRQSKVALFACGFFGEGNGTSYIFSIVISPVVKLSDIAISRVVWSANRDHPVGSDGILNFTTAGDLVLQDADGSIAWTTNTAGKSVAGMNLTDTGNLVLFNDRNMVVWQSFDHPTDCLLSGQNLFQGQKLKSLTDSTGQEGMFSLQVTEKGLFAYVESNPPQAYYSNIVNHLGNDTLKGRRYIRFLNGSLSLFIYSSDPSDPDFVFDIPQVSSAQYMQLMPDGHLQVFQWQSEWTMVADLLTDHYVDECGYPLVCGRNSICLPGSQQCICQAIEYFRPVNDRRQPELGCSEITPLTCNSTQDQDFIRVENVAYFTSSADMEYVNMKTCKQACLNNCTCKAAFFQYDVDISKGDCILPSEIFTMKALGSAHDSLNALAFIKVQNVTSSPLSNQVKNVTSHPSFNQVKNVTSPPSPNQVNNVTSAPLSNQVNNVTSPPSPFQVARVVGSTIGSFLLLLVVVIGLITYVAHKRKRDAEREEDYLDQLPGMPTRFSYDELKTATDIFSKKLGQGGFGSVFEGTLGDGTKIAVKCLEGLSHIKKSFLAEVQSLGSIHHVNLVRLRGFGTWKSQHFLVYDFMSNGSLDKWIYHENREHILEWDCRKKIITDIAKGLAYLHEECRQKIVHLDIKPQNILLDGDFNAKVSDFGLSKLIDKNQTEVISTIKGTPGYIAPEWRSSIITEKLDVYSFGIVLLEILCGRKIFDRSLREEESWYLLFVFEKCWEQGTLLDMVDKNSEDMQAHNIEVVQMMKVASWCLQTNYKRRPSMSSVVKVLEGAMNIESNLDYNFTDPRIQEATVGDEKDFTLLSSSLLSGPR